MRKCNGKSQITLFIILGVVLLLIAGTIFYLMFQTKQANSDEVFSRFLETTPLKSYVTQCLEHSLDEALYYAGRQGGIIYQSQSSGGRQLSAVDVLPYTDATGKTFNVSFGILTSNPFYPEPTAPYPGPLRPSYNDKTPYFGKNSLPELCSANGANAYNYTYLKVSCGGSYSPSKYTIQFYLENYTMEHADSCITNSTIWQDPTLKRYNITVGSPQGSVLFGENDVTVEMQYPITIRPPGGVPLTKNVAFQTKRDVRFKKLYFWAKSMVAHDTRDVFFHLPTAGNGNLQDVKRLSDCFSLQSGLQSTAPCWYPPMDVSKTSLCTTISCSNVGDIVTLTDDASQLFGKSLTFQFAVKNRPPALDFITNISVGVGDTITIQPNAMDPDEDNQQEGQLFYHYLGWLDGTGQPSDCSASPSLTGSLVIIAQSNTWESSPLYQQTRKDASYTTTSADVGCHVLRIWVEDNGRLHDYQDIKIEVNN